MLTLTEKVSISLDKLWETDQTLKTKNVRTTRGTRIQFSGKVGRANSSEKANPELQGIPANNALMPVLEVSLVLLGVNETPMVFTCRS